MTTYTALTTLPGREPAEALGAAMERLVPEPTGIGVFEVEDGSGLWEIGGYFEEEPDVAGLALLAASFGDRLGRPCASGTRSGAGRAVFRLWQP